MDEGSTDSGPDNDAWMLGHLLHNLDEEWPGNAISRVIARDGALVVEATDPAAAQHLIDKLLAALNDPGVSTYRGHPVKITCPALARFERSFP